MKKILLGLIILFITNNYGFCASALIKNYTPEELKNTLVKVYVKQGANIKSSSDYQIIVDEKGGFWTNVFYGSNFNSFATMRSTYNFVKDNKDTLMNLNMAILTNPNSAFENATPVNNEKTEAVIENLQKALNGYYGYGFKYKPHKNFLQLIYIPFDSDIKYSDRIYALNDKPIKNMTQAEIKAQLTAYQENQEIKLDLINKETKEKRTIIIKSKFIEPTIKKS